MIKNGEMETQKNDNSYSKLLFHPNFLKTIGAINDFNVTLPSYESNIYVDFSLLGYPPNGKALLNLEQSQRYVLNARKGQNIYKSEILVSAYDESIQKFAGLEGIAYLTSHSLVIMKDDYVPLNLVTFYFYTRSKSLAEKSEYIKYSEDPELSFKSDYINDRHSFLIDNIPEKTVLFVDGPLIGSQMSSKTRELNDNLLKKNIIPLFFVKNSTSNLVTNYMTELKGKYNSDMHWSYRLLQPGERTCLFKYTDQTVYENAKIFFYLKSMKLSPQRIEFDISTYLQFPNETSNLFDLIYYMILAQGDPKNPQIRPIAVAEKFARATLKLIDLNKIMRSIGIVPTMNETRFN